MWVPSQSCIDIIKKFEQCVLHPYQDEGGIWTIGWGSISYNNGDPVCKADPSITQSQADGMLEYEVSMKSQAINPFFANIPIDQNQFDACMDFAYNLGDTALKNSTLLKRIRANVNDPAIRPAFMMWDKLHIDGQLVESKGLDVRRSAEADLYFT